MSSKRNRIHPLVLFLVALGCQAISAGDASAQRPARERYQSPSGPTLSPYHEYFRFRTGPFDNYHSFVRPTINLQRTLKTQNRELNLLQREVRAAATASSERSEVAPTGVGSVYLNFSHYYPGRP